MLKKCAAALILSTACLSNAHAVNCTVTDFAEHTSEQTRAGTATLIPGTNLANVPIYTSTERCAQFVVSCDGYGSTLLEPSDMVAGFANGSSGKGYGGFKTFRLSGGDTKQLYACFGSGSAPITSITGRF